MCLHANPVFHPGSQPWPHWLQGSGESVYQAIPGTIAFYEKVICVEIAAA